VSDWLTSATSELSDLSSSRMGRGINDNTLDIPGDMNQRLKFKKVTSNIPLQNK
jgi:hypothetical protein